MFINNAKFIVSNFSLLRLIVYRVMIFIEVIQRIIGIWAWASNFSGWWVPSIIGFTEAEFALSFDI